MDLSKYKDYTNLGCQNGGGIPWDEKKWDIYNLCKHIVNEDKKEIIEDNIFEYIICHECKLIYSVINDNKYRRI